MKKLAALLIVLILCSTAFAETTLTPDAYLVSRGLMVLDEDTLASMGAEMDGMKFDCSYCALSTNGDPPAIVYKQDKVYLAMEMAAMFGNGTMDEAAYKSIFADFCANFDFDIYTYSPTDVDHFVYTKDTDLLDNIVQDGVEYTLYDSLDEFIASLN